MKGAIPDDGFADPTQGTQSVKDISSDRKILLKSRTQPQPSSLHMMAVWQRANNLFFL
jgi:hypothetical protein